MSTSQGNPEDLPTVASVTSGGGASPSVSSKSIGQVGRYKITRLIGEGGMGAVYEAEQDQPRRTVALKVIKAGLASPELLRRFAQESQALGRLQHPGIAQIYDAGTADTGFGPQPYFAMEFIRGETLRDYDDAHHLNTRQRLEIVVKVCDAVHHAHQRGLIHRDLKPGNILVDETGQPKILDFGVARVTDSDAQATMQTDVGQLVGTLAYMSPEQALADPLELDIRSDVYALGVILYELLAGRLPYTIGKKIHEALHTIREEDPAKLSSVNRSYRGDIETIVAKALEKNKNRRYASAAELGADISRYLKDEPIVAQPPSASYQIRKFARRHKALVLGLAAVFVVLLGGVVVSTYQAIRAGRAEEAALRERDRATAAEQTATTERDKAVRAEGQAVTSEAQAKLERDKAVAEKQRADTESATAKAVSEFLQKNLFEQVTGGTQRGLAADLSVSGALDRAAARIDGTFPTQPLVEAGVREAVANSYVSLFAFEKAASQVERALALRRPLQGVDDKDVLRTEHLLSVIYAGQRKFAESTRLLAGVVDRQKRQYGAEHSDTIRYAYDLGSIYLIDDKLDKAEPYLKEVADVRLRTLGPGDKETIVAMLTLAQLYEKQQQIPKASLWATRAYDSSAKSLPKDDTITLAAQAIVQRLKLKATPNGPANRDSRDEVLAARARSLDSQTATSLLELINLAGNRATIAINQGQPAAAEAVLLEALDATRRVGQDEPNLTAILAGTYAMQKKFADAETALRKITENPASKDMNPDTMTFALRSLASAYRSDGRFAEAEPHLVKLVPLALVRPGEGAQQTRVDMFLLAENYSNQRKYAEAEKDFMQLLDVQRRASGPEVIQTVVTIGNLGWVRLQQKRFVEAEKDFREAAAILVRTAPNTWERFNMDSMLGASLMSQRKFDEAEPLLVSGYNGMATAPRSTNPNNASRFTQDQAGDAIVQLYTEWPKPAKVSEWKEKLKP
jgi:eukaryotic-like serine/threonine-protein kinase